MTKKTKRSGRVTPKGTTSPSARTKGQRPDGLGPIGRTLHQPGRINRPKGRGARPTTHHRGNR